MAWYSKRRTPIWNPLSIWRRHRISAAHNRAYRRTKPWFEIQGDQTLRLDYDLNSESIAVDLGGYVGDWSAQIADRYGSRILVFEPVRSYFEGIEQRFRDRDNIEVFNIGLGAKNEELDIHVNEDRSSIFGNPSSSWHHLNEDTPGERIRLQEAVGFFREHDIQRIDVLKINIEGGEYDLLTHLLDEGWVENIVNIQVQFHDFVPRAKARMRAIQERLAQTHRTTFQFEFVWENWELLRRTRIRTRSRTCTRPASSGGGPIRPVS